MNEEHSRLEALGILLSYALVVMFSGEMPETNLPQPGEITPLVVEFERIYTQTHHGWREPLYAAVLPFVSDQSYWGPAILLEKDLRHLQLMPTAIRRICEEYIAERSPDFDYTRNSWQQICRWFPGIAHAVTRRTGAPATFMGRAWKDADRLDEAWRALRTKLEAELKAKLGEDGQ